MDKESSSRKMDIRIANMDYLELSHHQVEIHEAMMNLPIEDLPQSCIEQMMRYGKKWGICGDLLAVCIADWIKEKDKTLDEKFWINSPY